MPLSFSASMTRWKPSVSSCVSSAGLAAALVAAWSFSIVACVIGGDPPGWDFGVALRSVEKGAVLLDMGGQVEIVLELETRGGLAVPRLERLDDLHVVGDRPRGAGAVTDRHAPDGAHMDEQVLGRVGDELVAAHPDNRLV